MAARLKIAFTMRYGNVIKGLRVRTERMYASVNLAAQDIAEQVPAVAATVYPAKVANALMGVAGPSRQGARISAVQVRIRDPLFAFYELGVPEHLIEARDGGVLAFHWELVGGKLVFFDNVHSPGYEGRHLLPAFKAEFARYCYEQWYAAVHTAMTQ